MHPQSTIVTCAQCGTDFPPRPRSASKATQQWFCGQPCYWASKRKPVTPLADRFWAKVNKDGPVLRPELGPCWVWLRSRGSNGYGRIVVNGRLRGAHVVAYIITTGHEPPPETPWILHHCDGGSIGCVRPAHLFAGTPAGNVADMDAKGRRVTRPLSGDLHPFRQHPHLAARGERNAAAKMTAEIVIQIRERYANGDIRQVDLASEYGLGQSTLAAIVAGRSWAHVGGPITRNGRGGNQRRWA